MFLFKLVGVCWFGNQLVRRSFVSRCYVIGLLACLFVSPFVCLRWCFGFVCCWFVLFGVQFVSWLIVGCWRLSVCWLVCNFYLDILETFDFPPAG